MTTGIFSQRAGLWALIVLAISILYRAYALGRLATYPHILPREDAGGECRSMGIHQLIGSLGSLNQAHHYPNLHNDDWNFQPTSWAMGPDCARN
jgi:hypothetical protein